MSADVGGGYGPGSSTARTAHGRLAEDYAPVLADALRRWWERESTYFRAHPSELTDADRLRLNVAETFYLKVASTGARPPDGAA